MWTYQNSLDTFGGTSWACHVECGDYTYWRIAREEANQIPIEYCPESWGNRETWLEQIREARRRE